MGEVILNTKVGFLSVYGRVVFGTNSTSHPTIKVDLDNGYHVDLLARLIEAKSNWGSKCSVRLWQGSTDFTRRDAINSIASTFDGYAVVDFNTIPIQYSEYTSDLEHTSDFNVGGHDLMQIIQHGSFLLIDINFSGTGWDAVDDVVGYNDGDFDDMQIETIGGGGDGTSVYSLVNNAYRKTENFVQIPTATWTQRTSRPISITSTPTLTVDDGPVELKPDIDMLNEFF